MILRLNFWPRKNKNTYQVFYGKKLKRISLEDFAKGPNLHKVT